MRRIAVLLTLAVGLLAAAAASARVVERVPVSRVTSPVVEGLPRSLSIVLVSPEDYVRADARELSGTWTGPRFAAQTNPNAGGTTSIAWSVGVQSELKDAPQAAAAALTRGWPVDIKGGISVPHVVRRRTVGTILGAYVVTASPRTTDASYEAALAFPIAARVHAFARFELRGPTAQASTGGPYVVKQWIPVSIWNRGQAFAAVTGVRLEGNLPPTRVSARIVKGGRVLRGTVADAFRHPVVGIRVVVERLLAGGWRGMTSTRTDRRGVYTVKRIARNGTYRVVATMGSFTARSAVVSAGRPLGP